MDKSIWEAGQPQDEFVATDRKISRREFTRLAGGGLGLLLAGFALASCDKGEAATKSEPGGKRSYHSTNNEIGVNSKKETPVSHDEISVEEIQPAELGTVTEQKKAVQLVSLKMAQQATDFITKSDTVAYRSSSKSGSGEIQSISNYEGEFVDVMTTKEGPFVDISMQNSFTRPDGGDRALCLYIRDINGGKILNITVDLEVKTGLDGQVPFPKSEGELPQLIQWLQSADAEKTFEPGYIDDGKGVYVVDTTHNPVSPFKGIVSESANNISKPNPEVLASDLNSVQHQVAKAFS